MKILLCINEFKISSLAETLAVLVVFVEKVSVEIELHIAFLGGHVVQSLGRIESIEPAGRQHSIHNSHCARLFAHTRIFSDALCSFIFVNGSWQRHKIHLGASFHVCMPALLLHSYRYF